MTKEDFWGKFRSTSDREGCISDKVNLLMGLGIPKGIAEIYAMASYDAEKIMREARKSAEDDGASKKVLDDLAFIRSYGFIR